MRGTRAKTIRKWCWQQYSRVLETSRSNYKAAEFGGFYRRVKKYWTRNQQLPVLG